MVKNRYSEAPEFFDTVGVAAANNSYLYVQDTVAIIAQDPHIRTGPSTADKRNSASISPDHTPSTYIDSSESPSKSSQNASAQSNPLVLNTQDPASAAKSNYSTSDIHPPNFQQSCSIHSDSNIPCPAETSIVTPMIGADEFETFISTLPDSVPIVDKTFSKQLILNNIDNSLLLQLFTTVIHSPNPTRKDVRPTRLSPRGAQPNKVRAVGELFDSNLDVNTNGNDKSEGKLTGKGQGRRRVHESAASGSQLKSSRV